MDSTDRFEMFKKGLFGGSKKKKPEKEDGSGKEGENSVPIPTTKRSDTTPAGDEKEEPAKKSKFDLLKRRKSSKNVKSDSKPEETRKSIKQEQPKGGGKVETKSSPKQELPVVTLPLAKEEEVVALKQRSKKGKRPKFKKIERAKTQRVVGIVKRVPDKFFPGDVDYKYTSPKENWVSCFGQSTSNSSQDLDFGDSVRIIRDKTHL